MPDRLSHLDVFCYRWGTRYPADEVNILAAMVRRNLSVPHRFHCVTDDPAGLDPAILAHALPDDGVDGIWRKLGTFRRDFLGLEGRPVVSFDIDVVIVGSLDFLADRPDADFLIARNWSKSASKVSGSMYRLRVGALPHVWETFVADPERAMDEHHGKTRLIGEQNWLDHTIRDVRFFPDGKLVSFKKHCRAAAPAPFLARFGIAVPPPGAAVVSFHGDPLPRDVADRPHGRWRRAPFVREHWRL